MTKDSKKGRYASPDGSATWEYVAAISCSSVLFGVGSIFGWSSPGLGELLGPNTTIAVTDSDAAIMGACFALGFTLAPALTGVIADKFGRKNSLLAISVPIILNWGLIAVAKDKSVLFLARFTAGLPAGLILCLAPMYLGEIASVKLRGALGMVIGTTINAAILCMFLMIPYLLIKTSAYICLGIAIVSMISLWFIPESPYFLAMIGKFDEAEIALEKLRGKTDVTEELDLIKRTVSQNGRNRGESEEGNPEKSNAFKQLITVSGNRRALGISLAFLLVLQYGGYVLMMAYGHIILKAMKSGVPENLAAVIIASIQLVSNFLTIFVVDKFGRRPLTCISGVVSGACLMIIGIHFYLMENTNTDVTSFRIIPLIAMFVNIAALSIGLMPLQMVVQSEILATDVKSLVSCIIGVFGGGSSLITSSLFLNLVVTWGFGYAVPFVTFSLVTWTTVAYLMKYLPETKGKTFLEIQKDLNT